MNDQSAKLAQSDLRHWRLLDQFRRRLRSYYDAKAAADEDPRRKIFADDYFCLLLFGLFNPALKSMRALCHASGRFEKMRRICSRPIAAASFSEAQHAFDPEILSRMVRQLANEIRGRAEFGDPRLREAIKSLTAVDGTILRAVNRMAWAHVGRNGCAVKLHLHFSVFDQMPEEWTLTPGNVCERKTLKSQARAGRFYVADRLYSDDYAFLGKLTRQGTDFVFRLPPTAVRTPASVQRPLTQQDRAVGVVSDQMEQLGSTYRGMAPLRVVEIHSGKESFVLVTNRQDLSAELIGLIYRYRWQIELFFKWFKSILGSAHWMAESPRGAAIQLYAALIASLLLMLATGKRPTRRQSEAIALYFAGFATEDELLQELQFQKN